MAEYEQAYPEDVWRVREPVEVSYEPTAYVFELERCKRSPMLIFERLKGFDGPLVTNVFGSRERIARLLGTNLAQLHQTWAERTARLIPPTRVRTGPVQEVVLTGDQVDLRSLPIPKHFLDDAGSYISSGVCVARDPKTGRSNLSFARIQVKGSACAGLSLHSRGHLWDFFGRSERLGRSLELAVVVGAHPTVLLAAASRAPFGVDEYEIAGALQGQPVELVRGATVDVGVPANAELVIEGEIVAGAREPEGPFGEYTGYSTARSTENVFRLRAITQRPEPVYLDVTPGRSSEHLLMGRVYKEVTMLHRLRETLPNISAIHYPESGTHFHCYIALDKQMEGQPQQAANLLFGLDQYVKLVIIVDTDIDITNEAEVLWAVATRVQAKDDVFIVPRSVCNVLDPSSKDGLSSKMAIDATAPLTWDAVRHQLPSSVEQRVRSAVAASMTRLDG